MSEVQLLDKSLDFCTHFCGFVSVNGLVCRQLTGPLRGGVGQSANFWAVFMDEVPPFRDEVENSLNRSHKSLT